MGKPLWKLKVVAIQGVHSLVVLSDGQGEQP